MAKRIKTISGDEYEGLSKADKKWHNWGPGRRKKIKQLYNRRERRLAKLKRKEEYNEEISV